MLYEIGRSGDLSTSYSLTTSYNFLQLNDKHLSLQIENKRILATNAFLFMHITCWYFEFVYKYIV